MTTGIIRNGVISSVRTTPCPRNLRSNRSANAVPSTSDPSTGRTVSCTLTQTACPKKWSCSSVL
jgi:hypothetical protein